MHYSGEFYLPHKIHEFVLKNVSIKLSLTEVILVSFDKLILRNDSKLHAL